MKILELDQTYNSVDILNWNGRGKHMTRFMNAMSLLFPVGEKFFIQAVRPFEHTVNPDLQDDIRTFYKQEAHHSREHRKFNALMGFVGLDVDRINKECRDRLNKHCKNDTDRLIVTVILEKVTSGLATVMNAAPTLFVPLTSNPEAARMWLWHALEEIDHEHVAKSVLDTTTYSRVRYWKLHALVLKELVGQVLTNYKRLSKL